MVNKTVEEVVKGVRSFFSEIAMVGDYVNKVHFYEHEADLIEEQIKRKAFKCKEITKLSRKVHIRYFAERLSSIADMAEIVAERLSIYAIKRRI